jgi:uncharacterized membrane protein
MKNKLNKKSTNKPITLDKTYPYILVVGGVIGLLSAVMLTLDKLKLSANPDISLGCDLNPVVSCGSVIMTDQASVFGFPNPFIGIAAFAVVITIGMAIFAGATFKKWFWRGLLIGSALGVVFVHWLIYQTLYSIGALCPYCMVVWSVTMPIFWYTLLYSIQHEFITIPKKYQKVTSIMRKYHGDILLAWYIVVIFLILNRFWYYWSTLL